MTKEKLEKEAGNWLRKYLLCCNCEKKCNCIDSNSYCEEQVLRAYVDSAEPREKRIAELELKIKHITEHLEPQIMTALFEQVEEEVKQEQRIEELQEENARLKKESKENQDLATIAYMQGASKYRTKLDSKIMKLQEAKTIIQDLLSNSDEYARQRAMDFLNGE